MPRVFVRSLLVSLVALVSSSTVRADEGMWTYNNFPSDKVQAAYGFMPDQAWLDKVRLGSARLAQGCSASFVSKDGLVMTNHHCAHHCIAELSTKTKDLVKNGFLAKDKKAELKCPAMEVNQLVSITDVTAQINAATAGKSGAAYADAQKAEQAKITKACATSDNLRCDVVTLYKGGKYDLYTYRRYQDVRLAFAPELAIAFFGGDPDNFNFPRYDLDAAFVRVYENGKPLVTKDFLPFAKTPAAAGDVTFVSGHPGHTSREYTIAELAFERDFTLPRRLTRIAELRGILTQFGKNGPEQKRIAGADLFSIENGFKARFGREMALMDAPFFASKVKAQQELIDRTPAAQRPALQKAIAEIEGALVVARDLWPAFINVEAGWGLYSDTFEHARALVRAADELAKPNETRLKEFSDAAWPAMREEILSSAPIYKDLEQLKLSFGLTKLRETLTTDDPFVQKVLGKQSPDQLATALLTSKLGTVAERKKLLDALAKGDRSLIDKSADPMILFAKKVDLEARAVRSRYENEVIAVIDRASEVVAKARFAAWGTAVYPDATFTLRLSFGKIAGWKERGTDVPAMTMMGGAFDRHTGADPYALPPTWLKARTKINAQTPMNIATTNDIIGGNSGSPVVNKNGEVIGLIFDGNIHSLGGEYGFNPDNNRAVAVHASAIVEALRNIYGAGNLADELVAAP
jgi:V8-like Glu-specific endopeptidase